MMPIFFLMYSNYSFHEMLRFVIQNKFKQRKENRKGMSFAKDPNLMYNMKLICMWPISLHFH